MYELYEIDSYLRNSCASPNAQSLLFTTLSLPTSNDQLRHLIRSIKHLALTSNLTRCAAIAGRYVQRRVLGEEVSGPEEKRHWFGRHDGKVFWGWEVSDAECVPEDDVSVVDGGIAIRDPFWDTF
jgi:hypothetical protein